MSKGIVRKIFYLQQEGLSGIGFQDFRLMVSKCTLQASSFVLPLCLISAGLPCVP